MSARERLTVQVAHLDRVAPNAPTYCVDAADLRAVLNRAEPPPLASCQLWTAPDGTQRHILHVFSDYVHCSGGASSSVDAFLGWAWRIGPRP